MNKKKIIAAGGLVTNPKNEILFIFRRGKWDLPKGKLDEGENIEKCAIREVEEETGISNIRLGTLLKKTYHEYFDTWTKEEVLKETWWYSMKIENEQVLIPQIEEDIEKIEWVNPENLNQYLKNTFTTIVEVIDAFHLKNNAESAI